MGNVNSSVGDSVNDNVGERVKLETELKLDDMKLSQTVRDRLICFKNYDHFTKKGYFSPLRGPVQMGSYGTVYESSHETETGRQACVIKIAKIEFDNNADRKFSDKNKMQILKFFGYCQEIELLFKTTLEHPNIVKFDYSWLQYDYNEHQATEHDELCADHPDCMDLEYPGFPDYVKRGTKAKPCEYCTKRKGIENCLVTVAYYLYGMGNQIQEDSGVQQIPEDVNEALIQLKGLCVYLVMDKRYDQSLDEWLKDGREPKDKRSVIFQLISALQHVHSRNYCHDDLKSQNILIRETSDKTEVAIADFGLGKLCSLTVPKTDDEKMVEAKKKYVKNAILADMWSFGFIMGEILIPAKELHKLTEARALIKEDRINEARALLKELINDADQDDLLELLLDLNNEKEPRITSREILEKYPNIVRPTEGK